MVWLGSLLHGIGCVLYFLCLQRLEPFAFSLFGRSQILFVLLLSVLLKVDQFQKRWTFGRWIFLLFFWSLSWIVSRWNFIESFVRRHFWLDSLDLLCGSIHLLSLPWSISNKCFSFLELFIKLFFATGVLFVLWRCADDWHVHGDVFLWFIVDCWHFSLFLKPQNARPLVLLVPCVAFPHFFLSAYNFIRGTSFNSKSIVSLLLI